MKVLTLSVILATSLLTSYTYAATFTDSDEREEYGFETETSITNDRVNFSTPATTKSDPNELYGVAANNREEYNFGTEHPITVGERVNYSLSTTDNAEIWDFLSDEAFDIFN